MRKVAWFSIQIDGISVNQHYIDEGMKMEKDGVRSENRVVGVPQGTWELYRPVSFLSTGNLGAIETVFLFVWSSQAMVT